MEESKPTPSESFSVAQRTALGVGLAFAVLVPSALLWILWDRRHKKRKKEQAKKKYSQYRAGQPQRPSMRPNGLAGKRPLVTMISKPGSVHSPTSERGKPRSLALELEVERQDSFADKGMSQIDYDLKVQQEIDEAVELYKDSTLRQTDQFLRPPVAHVSRASSEQESIPLADIRISFPRPLQLPRSPPARFDSDG